MRSVRRTTWKIRHETVTVVRCHSFGTASGETFEGFASPNVEPEQPVEPEQLHAINEGNSLKTNYKREKDHE